MGLVSFFCNAGAMFVTGDGGVSDVMELGRVNPGFVMSARKRI